MEDDGTRPEGTPFQIFNYSGHVGAFKAPKKLERLAQTDILNASVQKVQKGGENNLHSHTGEDGFWMVLKGRAAFYNEADESVAEIGPFEGVVIPRDVPYWFESTADVTLEILHVSAVDPNVMNVRVDHRPRHMRGRISG